jgi:hypothetical protein
MHTRMDPVSSVALPTQGIICTQEHKYHACMHVHAHTSPTCAPDMYTYTYTHTNHVAYTYMHREQVGLSRNQLHGILSKYKDLNKSREVCMAA